MGVGWRSDSEEEMEAAAVHCLLLNHTESTDKKDLRVPCVAFVNAIIKCRKINR